MKIIYFFFIILAVTLQTTILASPKLSDAVPDLILLLAIFAGFSAGEIRGSVVGFSGGILLDCFSAHPVGLGAFSYTIAGTVSGILGGRLYGESALAQFMITFIASATFFVSFPLLKLAFGISPSITLASSVFCIVINAILAPFLFPVLRRLLKVENR